MVGAYFWRTYEIVLYLHMKYLKGCVLVLLLIALLPLALKVILLLFVALYAACVS